MLGFFKNGNRRNCIILYSRFHLFGIEQRRLQKGSVDVPLDINPPGGEAEPKPKKSKKADVKAKTEADVIKEEKVSVPRIRTRSTIIAGAFPSVKRSQPIIAPKKPPLNSSDAEVNAS